MIELDRHSKILEIVNEYQKIEVSKISELIGVSQVTVRKDLDMLSERGLLRREHGYAVINSSDDINKRLAVNYAVKKRIAQNAAELVADGETVMIESGSSCVLLAEELALTKKDITIITNSAYIADYIRDMAGVKVMLLGGEYQKESQVMIGPLTRICAKTFFVDKLFIGIDGFSINSGFTSGDMMRSEAVKAMAESANQVIVLTDSSKFTKQGLVLQFQMNEVAAIYTDSGIPQKMKDVLENAGVNVYLSE